MLFSTNLETAIVGAARAKSQRDRELRVLNRGTGAPGVGDVSTPSNSNRARRRTQKEVHGAVRTRPASGRLTALSTVE